MRQRGGYDGVHDGYLLARARGHARVDDEVGGIEFGHERGAHGGVDLAYAALHQHHAVPCDVAGVKQCAAAGLGGCVVE